MTSVYSALKYANASLRKEAAENAKTHLRNSPKLRSQSPAGVVQEIYGLLIAYFVIRKLAFEAAAEAGVSPRQISFTGTINILRVS